MGLFTFIDRISLLCDCRAIIKLMVKLQKQPRSGKKELCDEIGHKLDLLSKKGERMPEAAMTVIIPVQGKDNNLFAFMQIAKEHLEHFRN